jgi:hypothetical protein
MAAEAIGLLKASVTNLSSPGAISVPGLKVGDKVIGTWLMPALQWVAPAVEFEAVISVDDEIQQVGNISAPSQSWDILLVR